MAPDTIALRERLIELRDAALRQLADGVPVIDLGLLRTVVDCSACLQVLDALAAEAEQTAAETPCRPR